jgi:hypothetical protein
MLDGRADVPCGDVFSIGKASRKDENFFQKPGRFPIPLPL